MAASITWLGHATVQLELADGRVILIDPWLRENPACPEAHKTISRCDMMLLTHGHADHTADVAALVKQFDPIVVGNIELCAVLQRQIGGGKFSGMNTGGTQEIDGVRVTLTQAFHSSSVESPDGPIYAGMPNGLVIDSPGHAKIYHAGDTDVFGDMNLIADLHQPQIVMLPIGDWFTMGARGAALAVELLEPRVILPIHYKSFPVLAQSADDFREALLPKFKDRLVVPEVGQTMAWTADGLVG